MKSYGPVCRGACSFNSLFARMLRRGARHVSSFPAAIPDTAALLLSPPKAAGLAAARRFAFLLVLGALASLPVHAQTGPSVSVTGGDPVVEGTDVTFTLTLSSPAPPGGVTVSVSIGESQWSDLAEPMDTGQRTVTINQGQSETTIRVRTVDDGDHEPNGWLQFIVRPGEGYRQGRQSVARVVMLDDDGPAVTVTPRDLVVAEADDPATPAKENEASYTVVLGRPPTGTVTVTPRIHASLAGNASVDTTPLRFTAANWHVAQSVTVTGVNDNLVNERVRGVTVAHAVAGFSDEIVAPSVRVTVTDDDGNAAPSFASDASIPDLTYTLGIRIENLQLPRARSGDVVTYSLRPSPPAGLTFDANRTSTAGPAPGLLSGTPMALQGTTTYTYTATDRQNRTASLTFSITVVAEDLMPSFPPGTSIANRSYTKDVQIAPLVLPAATGGNGTLVYSLRGPPGSRLPPNGLSFDEETRTLSGTPTALKGPTTYTYMAADDDSDRATLTFTIEVEEPLAAVPNLTVTAVDGATDRLQATWDAVDGATRYAVRSVKASNSTLSGSDDITSTSHTFTGLEANTEYDITVTALGAGNPALKLARSTRRARTNSSPVPTVTGLAPSFAADAFIPDQSWMLHRAITDLSLPAATGGDGTLSYTLTGPGGAGLPAGLRFDAAMRKLGGTPTATQAATTYTYTATDTDGDTAELTFTITIAADLQPVFAADASIADQSYTQNTRIAELTLPAATGGDGALSYTLTGPGGAGLPAGLRFDAAMRKLGGTPTSRQAATTYTYKATDTDGDTAELTFTITIAADLRPVFAADASIADQSYTQNTRIAELTLPAATGGNGELSYTLTGPGGAGLPAGLRFDAAMRKLGGTPTATQAATTYTWTATDADGDTAELTFTITIAADLQPVFAADASIADQSYTQNTRIAELTLPAATGGNGALSYTLTGPGGAGLPAGLRFDAAMRKLGGTPTARQAATTYTWTATDTDGDTARLTFAITVAEDPRRARVQDALESALAAVARGTMAGALDSIGARFGDVGASGMSLAGQWVPLEGAAATAAAAAEDGGLRPCAAEWSGGGSGTPDCARTARSRSMTTDELFGRSAFSLHLGASEGGASDPETPLWSAWGRGDLGTFAGHGEPGVRYDGELRTGWLGVDTRAGSWVAGLAVSHGEGEADYAFSGGGLSGRGRLETVLTTVYPYGRWTLGDGLELRGVVGAGTGEARHRPEDGEAETGDLSMRMASVGGRRALPYLPGVALAVRGDASVTRIETDDGPDAIHGLSADIWSLRAGMEASKRFALAGEAAFEPFLEGAVRRDGGNDLEGSGVEIAGGLRYVAPGVAVEVRGRWLAAHSEDGAEEKGVSLTARAGPGADGRGLFFALSPRWGAGTDEDAGALWNEEIPTPSGSANGGAMDARLGYGLGLAEAGVLTPFAEAGLAGGESRRLRLGTRFVASRAAFGVELAGERSESGSAEPEHALRLDLELRF